jgi:osmoprotectant transport system ATP-binding protein
MKNSVDDPPQDPPALCARDVHKRYGQAVALGGVSLAVAAGECLALVGESGSGKTTLLRTFNRMVEIDEGTVEMEGRDVRGLDAIQLRRQIGYVPQDDGLLPHWNVARNVTLVPWLLSQPLVEQSARRALDLVGLDWDTFAGRWPHTLSGGQRQRVALARALAAGQRVVLLDEPFGALDAITRADLQSMFLRLRRATNIAVVLVTHDLHEASRLADRIAVLYDGRLVQIATPPELLAAPASDYVRDLLTRARLLGDAAC